MTEYRYCKIAVRNISKAYWYISDDGSIKENDAVIIPFGSENSEVLGTVESVKVCSEDDTPFSPERTKHIIRLATEEERAADADGSRGNVPPFVPCSGRDEDDIRRADAMIKDGDNAQILWWASDHNDSVGKPRITEKVIECYLYVINNGMPEVAVDLGALYYTGIVVPRDFGKAFEYYTIAANEGNIRAICNLGYCWYYGRDREIDYEKAYDFFVKGVLLANDANCLYKLGDMYQCGHYVEKNEVYAYKIYMNALASANVKHNADHVYGSDAEIYADICFRLGKCRLRGIGTKKDVDGALTYLFKALNGFYARRKTDPFVSGLIADVKLLIAEAEELLDKETVLGAER